VILVLVFAAFAVSLPTGGDSWEEVSEVIVPDNMILDAGSGGTKIFTYKRQGSLYKTWDNANVDSICPESTPATSSKGLAMLHYSPKTCKSQFQLWAPRDPIGDVEPDDILAAFVANLNSKGTSWGKKVPQETCAATDTPPQSIKKFRKFILQGMAEFYKITHAGATTGCTKKLQDVLKICLNPNLKPDDKKADSCNNAKARCSAKNAAAVPIVATAGMRMLDQEANTLTWANICGGGPNVAEAGYNFLPVTSDGCGTISGTQEAFYEYQSYVGKIGKTPSPEDTKGGHTAVATQKTGAMSMGGASAQMGFELVSEKQETAFKKLILEATKHIQCDHMKVSSGKLAPKFEKDGLAKLRTMLGKDMMPKDLTDDSSGCVTDYIDIKEDKKNKKKIATISFLNLAANPPSGVLGAPIAGGAQEMLNWAQNNCAGNKADCTTKLQKALKKDGFWNAVTEWFKSTKLGLEHFAYITDNANQKQFESAKALQKVPDTKCADFETGNFIWEGPKTDGATKKAEMSKKEKEEEEKRKKILDGKIENSGKCVKAIWASMYLTSFFGGKSSVHPESETRMGPNADWAEGYPLTLLDVDEHVDRVDFNYIDGFARHNNL